MITINRKAWNMAAAEVGAPLAYTACAMLLRDGHLAEVDGVSESGAPYITPALTEALDVMALFSTDHVGQKA